MVVGRLLKGGRRLAWWGAPPGSRTATRTTARRGAASLRALRDRVLCIVKYLGKRKARSVSAPGLRDARLVQRKVRRRGIRRRDEPSQQVARVIRPSVGGRDEWRNKVRAMRCRDAGRCRALLRIVVLSVKLGMPCVAADGDVRTRRRLTRQRIETTRAGDVSAAPCDPSRTIAKAMIDETGTASVRG